jgi:hypothetical protein
MYKSNRLIASIVFCASVIALFIYPQAPADSAGGFSVSPSKLEVTVSDDGSSPVSVYITSSFDGELVTGKEDIPYRIEPASVTVSSRDINRKVELTIYNDSGMEPGEYSGKLTFLAYTGTNIAYGIKVDILVKQIKGKGPAQGFFDEITGKNGPKYLVIVIAVAAVAVALVTGILIGRRSKKSPANLPSEQDDLKNGENE